MDYDRTEILRLGQRTDHCTVLGPGVRAALWVQGCPLRCRGCVSPDLLPFAGGIEVDVGELAAGLTAIPDIEGVTFSGGEPMAQAAALADLIDRIRLRRDLSFMSYTGYTLDQLRRHGTAAQRALLDRLDLLVDGPYLPERHTDLRWRGSDNQQVHLLTPRYRHLKPLLNERGVWLEAQVDAQGGITVVGIPPYGLGRDLEELLRDQGFHPAPACGKDKA